MSMIILDDIEDSENNWQRFLKKKKKNKDEVQEDVPSPSAAGRKNSNSSVDGIIFSSKKKIMNFQRKIIMTTQQILKMKILQQTRLNLLGDKKSFEQSGPVRERIAQMISSFEHG